MNAELMSKTPAIKVAHAIAGNAGDLSFVNPEAVALMRGTLGRNGIARQAIAAKISNSMAAPIRVLTAVPICDGHDSAILTINSEFIRHGTGDDDACALLFFCPSHELLGDGLGGVIWDGRVFRNLAFLATAGDVFCSMRTQGGRPLAYALIGSNPKLRPVMTAPINVGPPNTYRIIVVLQFVIDLD
jgi:hypothetical protein